MIDVMEGDDRPESNAAKTTPLVRALLGFCREAERAAARPARSRRRWPTWSTGRRARADVVHLVGRRGTDVVFAERR